MTLDEIKAAVDAGKTVHWHNPGYIVHRDTLGQYLITFKANGHTIGLTNRAGDRLNGQEQDFYVADQRPVVEDTDKTLVPGDPPMQEEITVTVQMIYSCPAEAVLSAQSDMIHTDLCRLMNTAPTSEIACRAVTISHIAAEAETYGNVHSDNVPAIQADRTRDALTLLYPDADGAGELLRNALCDLRHLADADALSFALYDRSAQAWYRAEKSI